MDWIEVSVWVSSEAVEPVCEVFSRYASGGVAVEEEITPIADHDGYKHDPEKPVLVKAYLPGDPEEQEKIRLIREGLWYLRQIMPALFGEMQTNRLAEADWANAWKEHFYVQRVGKRIIIKPSWREHKPGQGELVIELDPGMAFGTGQHPTTRLCLEQLENLVQPGMTVLDVGTGSAILSIAAALLGAREVRALDTSTVAVEAALSNVQANGMSDRISIEHGTVVPHGPEHGQYDLVVANIIASVIDELAPSLAGALRPGGLLIAGGIIAERLPGLQAQLGQVGFTLVTEQREGDWVVLVCQKT